MPETINTENSQLVGVQVGGEAGAIITVALPRHTMTRAEAIRHAAWIVALADPNGEEFAKVLEAVKRT